MLSLLFLFLIFSVVIKVHGKTLELLLKDEMFTESKCLKHVSNSKKDDDITKKAFTSSIERSYWECATLMAKNIKMGVDLRSEFDLQSRLLQKHLADLKTTIEQSLPMSTVAPAYQWAQSLTDVLLNVKFSHKLDAPATLNVEASNVTITKNQIIVKASDGRKNFNLDIGLLKNIRHEESTWSMASVGRMSITLKKEYISRWARLQKSKKKPANQHFWFDVHEQYADALERFEEDDGEEKPNEDILKKDEKKENDDKVELNEKENEKENKAEKEKEVVIETPEEREYLRKKSELTSELRKSIEVEEKKLRDAKKSIDKDAKKKKDELDSEHNAMKAELEKKNKDSLLELDEKFGKNNNNNNSEL